ncbi:Nitrogen assimilation transcription factor nit-4 [Acrodontium crateriforme]|uniref:Nitrogen assimilation transcription factor nit-4 n=1 Tax=Acrodontium crateriforme TaxID=150365 RepID=A0AAQ3MB51_9PEZI|nr:Nitrogen assimilation transcription factor nit-4 [Acrodontium crateriforme]
MEPATALGDVKPSVVVETISSADGTKPHPIAKPRAKNRRKTPAAADVDDDPAKRRCVSTACVACRKRKSKCDGNIPACAACSQVYSTECIYDPNSDHRRKGVYKNDVDNLKIHNSTLQTLVQALLNYAEDDVPALVREIRTCESLDVVAERIVAKEQGLIDESEGDDVFLHDVSGSGRATPTLETLLYGKMADLRLTDGSTRYIGGTSHLMHMTPEDADLDVDEYSQQDSPITSWTTVTHDPDLVMHLLNMYFTWHYTYFTTLSKTLFLRDFLLGKPPSDTRRKTHYCTPLLVNAILALGCHFTSHPGSRSDPEDSGTAGDHFFREAKRLIMENDEHEKPRLTTVQALALMSVREAGCGREAKGWVYSGMSFRMACDMGLNLDSGRLTSDKLVNGDEAEEDVRRVTFWGCFLFDKCWSNYLGRLPQLPLSSVTVPKIEVFPDEDSSQWAPYTDSGFTQSHAQPARTRAVALQITKLCEISGDLMKNFYDPTDMEKTKGKAAELKKLSDIHTRLESWRRDLPKELEPKEGALPSVLTMHMFFQLLYIHLFRPFLKYTQATSPLPQTVSPRKLCTQAAAMISKLMRLYKRSHGLRQICNIVIYILHSACTIHLLNLPDKNAKRDIVHGVKHLEEIAEGWLGARRTLGVLSVLSHKWKVDLPEEAVTVLTRTDLKFKKYVGEIQSPSPFPAPSHSSDKAMSPPHFTGQSDWHGSKMTMPTPTSYLSNNSTDGNTLTRTISGNNAMPDHDVQQYMSAATTTPPTVVHQDHRHLREQRTATSPSDMFGGVQQLMRDSEHWVYKDQQRLAMGFDNWTSARDHDASAWSNGINGVITGSGTIHKTPNFRLITTGGIATSAPNQIPSTNAMNQMSAQSQHTVATESPNNSANALANGYGLNGWLNGMNNMPLYDESSWYQ